MNNKDYLKKLSLIFVGIVIVFSINTILNFNKGYNSNTINYPLDPFSAELLLITSAGQSTDAYIFHDIINKLQLNNHFMPEANTYDLREYSSVVIVVGHSEVGMMLNDVLYQAEVKRIRKILQTAEAEQLPVIAAYLGGDERLSNETQSLLKSVCDEADYIIMTSDTDKGPLIKRLTNDGQTPITCVPTIDQLSMTLASIFK